MSFVELGKQTAGRLEWPIHSMGSEFRNIHAPKGEKGTHVLVKKKDTVRLVFNLQHSRDSGFVRLF